MRRFNIGSGNRFFLLGGIALGSQLGLGGSPAMAQTYYDFSFNTNNSFSPEAGSIEFILSGQNVTGTVAGSGTGILSGGSLSTTNNYGGDGTVPMLSSTSNAPFFMQSGKNIVFIDTSSDEFGFFETEGSDYVEEVTAPGNGSYVGESILSNESLTMTPAPIPGSGILSYLALGLGGLFFYRRRLWRAARMAIGKIGSAASLALRGYRPLRRLA
jgi:hypothetical protein